jgi:uncharacterized protein (TIGR02270 family)
MGSVTAASFIPEIVDQHNENAASLWLARDNAVRGPTSRLADLVRLDERVEANVDALRVAQAAGWVPSLDALDNGGAGEFFTAGVLAAEAADRSRLANVIECAFGVAARIADQAYHPAYDPWRGLASALAWIDPPHATRSIDGLKDTPRPRSRWLSIATCGARRAVREPNLGTALDDPEPLVRARAARAIGELGRSDLRAYLNARLADSDEECRFWCAWSATRLGAVEGLNVLAEFAGSPGPYSDRAFDLLLRCLSIERANAFLRAGSSSVTSGSEGDTDANG